jgi:hypothetical protein
LAREAKEADKITNHVINCRQKIQTITLTEQQETMFSNISSFGLNEDFSLYSL